MEEEALFEIKRKVKELEQHLMLLASLFSVDRDWTRMLQLYALAAATLKEVQDRIPISFGHYAVLPDFKEHEEKELLPDYLNTKCFPQHTRTKAIDSNKKELSMYTDTELEGKIAHFNKVCRGLQTLFKGRT